MYPPGQNSNKTVNYFNLLHPAHQEVIFPPFRKRLKRYLRVAKHNVILNILRLQRKIVLPIIVNNYKSSYYIDIDTVYAKFQKTFRFVPCIWIRRLQSCLLYTSDAADD